MRKYISILISVLLLMSSVLAIDSFLKVSPTKEVTVKAYEVCYTKDYTNLEKEDKVLYFGKDEQVLKAGTSTKIEQCFVKKQPLDKIYVKTDITDGKEKISEVTINSTSFRYELKEDEFFVR